MSLESSVCLWFVGCCVKRAKGGLWQQESQRRRESMLPPHRAFSRCDRYHKHDTDAGHINTGRRTNPCKSHIPGRVLNVMVLQGGAWVSRATSASGVRRPKWNICFRASAFLHVGEEGKCLFNSGDIESLMILSALRMEVILFLSGNPGKHLQMWICSLRLPSYTNPSTHPVFHFSDPPATSPRPLSWDA